MSQRSKVIQLYKTLLYMGRDYPKGYDFFKKNLRRVFEKNKGERDPEKINNMLAHGNFVIKELEALYMLRKYRTLKKRYYEKS
ncbi:LYR motif-containing protein 5 [Melipona quadrifasciata]|uniref:LYR motif-containing protein 5 n=1 Tax=Melipona quadrifasciata TaxID=166423 RepID=A0A0M9A382_9HYME|nr:LYR motif-containing protein 5 [Melipona quadrifasciata]